MQTPDFVAIGSAYDFPQEEVDDLVPRGAHSDFLARAHKVMNDLRARRCFSRARGPCMGKLEAPKPGRLG